MQRTRVGSGIPVFAGVVSWMRSPRPRGSRCSAQGDDKTSDEWVRGQKNAFDDGGLLRSSRDDSSLRRTRKDGRMWNLLRIALLLGAPSVVAAAPRKMVGAGVGFAELIHLDYQRWVTEQTSIDVALTPLLVLNILSVGASLSLIHI